MVRGIDANIIALKWKEKLPQQMLQLLRAIASSIRFLFKAPFWIRDRQHQIWYVYAIVLALVVFGFNWWGVHIFHQWIQEQLVQVGLGQTLLAVMEWAHIDIANEGNPTTWQSMVSEFVVAALGWMYWALAIWFEIKTLKYVLLAFSGPLVSLVSEQAESEITGVTIAFNGVVWARDLLRSILFAIVLFFAEITVSLVSFGVVLFTLVFFPLVAPILSVFAFAFSVFLSSFVFGLSSFDPIWERRGLGVSMRFRKAWSEKWALFGLGLPFHIAMAIPVVSIILAPVFLPVFSAVGAVLISQRAQLNTVAKMK